MSRREWEHGKFKLPSAEYAPFRKAIQKVESAKQERAFAATQECWKSLTRKQRTDLVEYENAVEEFIHRADRPGEPYHPLRYGNGRPIRTLADDPALNEAKHLMLRKVDGGKPERVLKSDVEFPTNRTATFHDSDCMIHFDPDAKSVTWEVAENNHAVEHARDSLLGKAFFGHLQQVRWTHGTGGTISGNDEYNCDDVSIGGGGNYCTGAYGYLGAQRHPEGVEPFTNARGQRVDVELSYGRNGVKSKIVTGGTQGRRAAGQPTGGQFAPTARSTDTGVNLGGGRW